MGSLVYPAIANNYLEHFESLAIPTSPTLMKWWLRYVDDIHSATRKDHLNKLQEHLNSIYPHIIYTKELPETDGLPILDTLTKPAINSNESIVYRKLIHIDRYLDCNSNQPIPAKLSVIHTVILKAKQVCSTPKFLEKEMDHHHKVLHDNHYTAQLFQQGKFQQKVKPNTGKSKEGARIVISYIKGISEQYRCTLVRYKARVFFKAPAPSSLYSQIQKIQFQILRKLI